MMADELDIGYDSTSVVMGSTDVTPDQGGSGGSDAIQTDGWPMRRVAAEARRILLALAAERFGVPVDLLSVNEAVVSMTSDPSRKVTYAELIGGQRFDVNLRGRTVNETTGVATVKPVDALRIVGQSPMRFDIPPKVDGSLIWAVDVTLPGMVHARNIKPPVVGARLRSVDESSVENLPGFIQVVRKVNWLAVVCEREEQAITAARRLKTDWEKPEVAPFPTSDKLFAYMRSVAPKSKFEPEAVGDPDAALRM
jgi:CO/xanthine dehydrogenase Mo-binding subunit